MDNVTPGMCIGLSTEMISTKNRIIPDKCVESNMHYIYPQLFDVAPYTMARRPSSAVDQTQPQMPLAINCTSGV
ncbi:MAG: hypothetical protein ABI045_04250 [Flavobacteriales bacterium]